MRGQYSAYPSSFQNVRSMMWMWVCDVFVFNKNAEAQSRFWLMLIAPPAPVSLHPNLLTLMFPCHEGQSWSTWWGVRSNSSHVSEEFMGTAERNRLFILQSFMHAYHLFYSNICIYIYVKFICIWCIYTWFYSVCLCSQMWGCLRIRGPSKLQTLPTTKRCTIADLGPGFTCAKSN